MAWEAEPEAHGRPQGETYGWIDVPRGVSIPNGSTACCSKVLESHLQICTFNTEFPTNCRSNFSIWLDGSYLKSNMPQSKSVVFPIAAPTACLFYFSQWMTTWVLPRLGVLSFIFQTHWTLLLKHTRQDHCTPVLWPPAPSHWCDGVTSRGWPCAIFALRSLISALLNTLTEWVFWRSC